MAAGIVAAVVVLTAVLVAVLGGSQSAQAIVANAATSTLNDKTAAMAITGTVDSGGSTVTLSGTGRIDFTQNAAVMQLGSSSLGSGTTVTAEFIGGTLYEQIPGLGQLLPGKSWMSIDFSSLTKSLPAATAGSGTLTNPSAFLRLLTNQGATVVALGPSTVDGSSVQGYSVTISSATIQNEIDKAELPAWMSQVLSSAKIGAAHIDVYVDGTGHLVRQAVSYQYETSGSSNAISETIDFSDFGAPVSITAPPADQVASLQSLLAVANELQGGASSS